MNPFAPEVIPVFEKAAGIRAFFTTRRGGFSTGSFASLNLGYFSGDDSNTVKRNWELLLRSQELEGKSLSLPRLCHGTGIEEVSSSATSLTNPSLENIDAVYTREENRVLAVTMGDCLTALIADPQTRCIAAVHAGWRGTRNNILGKTIRHLFETARCKPESTLVALGPCLSIESLEISKDVADTLPGFFVHEKENRFYFDLQGCNRAQAVNAGVFSESISCFSGCTKKEPDRFFSYRRDGANSGRMAACITLI